MRATKMFSSRSVDRDSCGVRRKAAAFSDSLGLRRNTKLNNEAITARERGHLSSSFEGTGSNAKRAR